MWNRRAWAEKGKEDDWQDYYWFDGGWSKCGCNCPWLREHGKRERGQFIGTCAQQGWNLNSATLRRKYGEDMIRYVYEQASGGGIKRVLMTVYFRNSNGVLVIWRKHGCHTGMELGAKKDLKWSLFYPQKIESTICNSNHITNIKRHWNVRWVLRNREIHDNSYWVSALDYWTWSSYTRPHLHTKTTLADCESFNTVIGLRLISQSLQYHAEDGCQFWVALRSLLSDIPSRGG